ncbi:MAG TPA: hypothetical protein VEQ36_13565 [Thermomicrobiales bacterium]|nr:hypothetical protein [Thermomicrobiales bacterium]
MTSSGYEVLEVVQYHEHLPITDQPRKAIHTVIGPGTLDTEGSRNGRNQQFGPPDRSERYVHDAIPELAGQVAGKLDNQACFPYPTGSGHGHEPDVRLERECLQVRQFPGSANERG